MSEETAGPASPAPEEESKTPTKLTVEQWAEARALCETGAMRPSEIARKFGITASAVSQFFSKNGVVYGSKKGEVAKAVATATAVKTAEAVAPFAIRRIERIEETKSQHYQYSTWIAQETMRVMAEAKKGSLPVSSAASDVKTLRIAAQTLSIVRQERYAVLDADQHIDEEELPSIEIRDLTDEEIQHMQDLDPDADLDMAPASVLEVEEDDVVVTES